jgi:hypothetical protein
MEKLIKLSLSEPVHMGHEKVTVKNASLVCRCDIPVKYEPTRSFTGNYDLWHYTTVIMRIRDGQITVIKPCSRSSIRAINQTLMFLGFKVSCQDIVKAKLKAGETIDKSYSEKK